MTNTQKQREYSRQWYLENSEKVKANQEARRRAAGKQPATRYNLPEEEICKRLLETDATTRSIAAEYGCNASTIKIVFQKHTTAEQRLEAKRRKQGSSIKGRKFPRGRKPVDPEARRARWRLGNAVRDGRVIKPTKCTVPDCEYESRIEAHHWHGYDDDHALDVIWLCATHHRREEKKSRSQS